eukprot:scaffold175_cov414-Prasinococcus_capsulatus_cf.AAC.30
MKTLYDTCGCFLTASLDVSADVSNVSDLAHQNISTIGLSTVHDLRQVIEPSSTAVQVGRASSSVDTGVSITRKASTNSSLKFLVPPFGFAVGKDHIRCRVAEILVQQISILAKEMALALPCRHPARGDRRSRPSVDLVIPSLSRADLLADG